MNAALHSSFGADVVVLELAGMVVDPDLFVIAKAVGALVDVGCFLWKVLIKCSLKAEWELWSKYIT